LDRVVPMRAVEVSTSRAGARPTVAVSRLTRDALVRTNWGQDTPMALATQPGVFAYSDAGNGIGYSYLTLRGFPQRRVSVLVNGVPLNDPESHEVYWIDHPDLLSATSEVQVQRGVGPALYGAASLGGSVNVETGPMLGAPHASITSGAGSWGTRRVVVEGGSGPLANGWNLYGRYARVESDGYREQSWSKLWSYAFSAERGFGAQRIKVNLYGGPEETHLSYLALPPENFAGGVTGDADRDRRANPLSYDGERDHFFEPHYELVHTWAPSPRFALTQTLFAFDGRGYFDERRFGRALADYRLPAIATTDTTLVPREYYAQDGNGVLIRDGQGRASIVAFDLTRRREVTNRHYGWLPRARYAHTNGALTVGGELRLHDGRHVGSILAGDPLPNGTANPASYYDYHPRTLAAGLYAREEYDLSPRWRVTADLAWRHAGYQMRGDRFDGIRFDQNYDFTQPRLALGYAPSERVYVFGSYSYASREPAFRDLYDAEGVGSVPLYRQVNVAAGIYNDPLIKPEHVHDLELGATLGDAALGGSLQLYRMDFRDELVFAGQFNTDLGYAILGNAARSVHQGVELAAHVTRALAAGATLGLDGNATLGDHHFVEYRERSGPLPTDEVRYDGNPIGFAPAVMANVGLSAAWRGADARLEAQHAGRVYVDNTGDAAHSIAPHTVWNASAGLTRAVGGTRATLRVRGLNLGDLRYATTGYMDVDRHGDYVPHAMPAATRTWLAELRLAF
ncbi:MAG: TonB-dependent receptor, partial [Candidatus Eisenbacteria bacterium]|nr:TonB-dependent receptor [Candidatus Eisenbacteria bacterium]